MISRCQPRVSCIIATIFDGFAAENSVAATITGLGDPVQIAVFKATADWFNVLGVQPIRGRTFLTQEDVCFQRSEQVC
jgi:hypothetical protein